MSNLVAHRRQQALTIGQTLSNPQFRKNLAQSMGVSDKDPVVDRFTRVAMQAIQSDPKLLDADRNSLFLACQSAATDGLMPDGRQGKLVIFNTKDGNNWINKVQWQRMIGGLRVLAARVGFDLLAEVVYANDTFRHRKGSNPGIDHEPGPLGQDPGDIIGFYAVATSHKTGRQYFEVMSKAQVDKVAQTSKSKDRNGNLVGPWRDWYDEQGRKTVAKRLFKSLPLFDDTDKVDSWIRGDNEEFDLGDEASPPAAEQPATPRASTGRPSSLQAVVDSDPAAQEAEDDVIDVEHEEVPAEAAEEPDPEPQAKPAPTTATGDPLF